MLIMLSAFNSRSSIIKYINHFKSSGFCHTSMLIAFSIISYSHAITSCHTFVFDDVVAVQKNPDVTNPINLAKIFTHDFWGANLNDSNSHKSFRPLTILMFNIEYNYWNFKVFHMKLINIALHCINTLLVYKIFTDATSMESPLGLLTALLFAVHPVHVEAVCGLVGRAELMFAFLTLLSLWIIDSASPKTSVILVSLLSMIAILFKETAITIPLTCIFYDFINTKHYKNPLLTQMKLFFHPKNVILIVVTAIILIYRLWIQDFEQPTFKAMDNPIAAHEYLLTRLLSQSFIYVLNIWILLCPQWLCFDWALGCVELVHSLMDRRVLLILFMYSFAWKLLISKNRLTLLGLGLLVIPFLPASGILKVGFVLAERILYVPSIGFCLIVANSFARLVEKYSKQKIFLWFLAIVVLICFLFRTRQRAIDWMTEEKLFSSALSVCPNNAKVHYNIARLASDKGDKKKALSHYHKAIELYPEYEAALMNLGNVYREKGDLVTAEKYLKDALSVSEEFPAAWMNLGIVQASQKIYTEALSSYRRALEYRKNYAICLYNMGNLFLEMQQYTEAISHWKQALKINPNQPKAWANILTLLDSQGLHEHANRLSERALKILPQDVTIMFIRANTCGKLKRYIEAEDLYKKIITMEPLNAIYHTNLGVLYHRWGKFNDAINSYSTAIRINPAAKTATENLKKLHDRNTIPTSSQVHKR